VSSEGSAHDRFTIPAFRVPATGRTWIKNPQAVFTAYDLDADLAFYTLDELRFSGSHDPISALLLCAADRADRVRSHF
jgi:hypothetical protein